MVEACSPVCASLRQIASSQLICTLRHQAQVWFRLISFVWFITAYLNWPFTGPHEPSVTMCTEYPIHMHSTNFELPEPNNKIILDNY